MATIAQIRAAIAAAIVIDGLRVHSSWPGQINAPAAVVRRKSTNFGVDFEGSDDHMFAVSVFVATSDPGTAQERLDAYLSTSGTSSIKAALENASATLTGVIQFLNVEGVEEEGITSISGIDYLSGTINITVGST
jgi:hypothetical protein